MPLNGSSVADNLFRATGIRQLLSALLYILRSGKCTELFQFAVFEARYWCSRLLTGNTDIQFTRQPFLYCRSGKFLDVNELTRICGIHGFDVQITKTPWAVVAGPVNGRYYGATYDRPKVLKTATDLSGDVEVVSQFQADITSILFTSRGSMLIATKGEIFKAEKIGFRRVLKLSNPEALIWHNHGFDEMPEGLVIGEYGTLVDPNRPFRFWKSMAYIYVSQDDGANWSRIDKLVNSSNKHIHLVRYSRRLKRLLVTLGDRRKQSFAISKMTELSSDDLKLARLKSRVVGGGHTGFCETDKVTLLGTDHHGGINWIAYLEKDGKARKRALPFPYRRYPLMAMAKVNDEHRPVLFVSSIGSLSKHWKSLLFYSNDHARTWRRLIEYDRTDVFVDVINGADGPTGELVLSVNVRSLDHCRTAILRPRRTRMAPISLIAGVRLMPGALSTATERQNPQ